jgi:hypothetical protein
MKWALWALMIWTAGTIATSSMINGISVEKTIARDSGNTVALLIKNDTKEHVKVIEARACDDWKSCETVYVKGDFRPGTRSWSEDFNLKESMRLLVLVRVQSIEEAAR